MRITAGKSSGRVSTARAGKRAGGAGGVFMPVAPRVTGSTVKAAGEARALGSVEALLAVQGLPDARERRAKAVRRGNRMLDLLDEVKIGLLSGSVPEHSLRLLNRIVRQKPDAPDDPQLTRIMEEIGLRSQVELAKLEAGRRGTG
jgi:hypothetical protein